MADGSDRSTNVGPQLTDDQFRSVLDSMWDEVAIGVTVRDDRGEIVDFTVVHANQRLVDGAGRAAPAIIGRQLCDLYPGARESGLIARIAAVVESGEPFIDDRMPFEGVTDEGVVINGYWSMSVTKFADGYIAATRDVTQAVAEGAARRDAEAEAGRARMSVELLQRAALPARLPRMDGIEVGFRYEPAASDQVVGGDWYDAFEIDEFRLGLVIADVAGHGTDAASFMLQVRNVLRAMAFEHGAPDVVLAQTNDVVVKLDEQSLFATACFGVYDRSDGSFSWSSAGHLDPLHLGTEVSYLPSAAGPPLGVVRGAAYPVSRVELRAGERLVLFTDGLVEVRDQSISACLDEAVTWAQQCAGLDAQGTADAMVVHAGDRSDDVALLCLRVLT